MSTIATEAQFKPGPELNKLVAETLGMPEAPYSEDIKSAFEVVYHMRRAGYYSQHTDLTMDSGKEWWHWIFYDYMAGGSKGYHGYGPVELAICLAALHARGVIYYKRD